jgi:hypothetical protein
MLRGGPYIIELLTCSVIVSSADCGSRRLPESSFLQLKDSIIGKFRVIGQSIVMTTVLLMHAVWMPYPRQWTLR